MSPFTQNVNIIRWKSNIFFYQCVVAFCELSHAQIKASTNHVMCNGIFKTHGIVDKNKEAPESEQRRKLYHFFPPWQRQRRPDLFLLFCIPFTIKALIAASINSYNGKYLLLSILLCGMFACYGTGIYTGPMLKRYEREDQETQL